MPLFEHERMERELAELLGRNVDLVSRRAIEWSENALRRNSISLEPCPSLSPDNGTDAASLGDPITACSRVIDYPRGLIREWPGEVFEFSQVEQRYETAP